MVRAATMLNVFNYLRGLYHARGEERAKRMLNNLNTILTQL